MTFRQRAEELVAQMTLEEKISQMWHVAPAIERLGIPAYVWWNECLHGVGGAGTATVFPQSIGMAASFNTDLLNKTAEAISDEARAQYNEYKQFGETLQYQGLTFWSPNIFRDPRWGRGHETYGEDPYLTGRMGTAFIKGLQGNGKYRKLDSTIKHFAVHSGPEQGRRGFCVEVSEKDLYETYLWAFQYCIDHASPSAVMGAYNSLNGEACCASKTLLHDILREKFGFDGYVVSDCGAVSDAHLHFHYTNDAAESAALAVNSGCELECGPAYYSLMEAVERGLVTEETITEVVTKLFTARFRLGMFDDDCEYDKIPFSVIECKEHRDLNRRMAQESIVLLKNNGILPLDRNKKVAVIGPNADSKTVLLGNYNGFPSVYYTLLRGIQEYADVIYSKGCHIVEEGYSTSLNTSCCSEREAIVAAKHADVVILCMGLDPTFEGEECDPGAMSFFGGDKPDLELPAVQKKLFEKIAALGKPMVFVNVSGSSVNLSRQKEVCDGIIQCFYPGAMGGLALADILFGTVSPSGRLPVTFYADGNDLPDFTDYSMKNRTYKFYEGTPVYEFGYGLTYSEITENWLDENTVELTNAGSCDTAYSVLKFEYIPHKNLCGFRKVFLKTGETATIRFDQQ
ncbi:MAG: glycoside hydrolase family 3 C-terminal domain-containing protein [Clostridia bacterium]|nr:glycoside hydrolase family 3 C-terminal domain-containing protein [Clostridia bacterium]